VNTLEIYDYLLLQGTQVNNPNTTCHMAYYNDIIHKIGGT